MCRNPSPRCDAVILSVLSGTAYSPPAQLAVPGGLGWGWDSAWLSGINIVVVVVLTSGHTTASQII